MAKPKVSLGDMILYLESEIFAVDAWRAVYEKENKPLPSGLARRQLVSQAIIKILDLVKAHENEFVAIIKKNRSIPEVATDKKQAHSAKPESVELEDSATV